MEVGEGTAARQRCCGAGGEEGTMNCCRLHGDTRECGPGGGGAETRGAEATEVTLIEVSIEEQLGGEEGQRERTPGRG